MAGTSPEPSGRTGRDPVTGMPRWVRVLAILALVAVLLVVLLVALGSHRGPSRHGSGGPGGSPPAVAAITDHELGSGNHR